MAWPAAALNILLTNDDGFETANTRALYQVLKDAGNNVVVAAPANQQSGTGAALTFGVLPALTQDSRYASVKAGSPAVGRAPDNDAIYYVNGSPVTAVLYGIDVLAKKRFDGPPDLIISGPNIGHNLGRIVISSGTVGATLYGIARGIPSVAVSYASTPARSYRELNADAIEMREAHVVQRLVASLKKNSHDRALLPDGVGLSVNVPAFDDDTDAGDLAFKFTSISCIGARDDYFVPLDDDADNADSAPRLGYGKIDDANAARLGIDFNCPQDHTPKGVPPAEAVALGNGFVTVTPIQATVQAFRSQRDAARIRVQDLVEDSAR